MILMNLEGRKDLLLLTSPSLSLTTNHSLHFLQAASRPANDSQHTTKTSQDVSSKSESPLKPLVVSQSLSGSRSSEGKPSTLTTSSPLCITLQLMKWERLTLEMQRSALASLGQSGRSAQPLTGLQLGILLPKQWLSPSLTIRRNSAHTAILLTVNSKPNSLSPTLRSSCSILPFTTSSKEANLASSLTTRPSHDCIQPFSCQTVPGTHLKGVLPSDQTLPLVPAEANPTSATASTPPQVALPLTLTAGTATSAKAVKSLDTGRTNAQNNSFQPALSSHPKYLCYNLWDAEGCPSPTITDWSESALPLPHPPPSELNNTIALCTLNDNPTLF